MDGRGRFKLSPISTLPVAGRRCVWCDGMDVIAVVRLCARVVDVLRVVNGADL